MLIYCQTSLAKYLEWNQMSRHLYTHRNVLSFPNFWQVESIDRWTDYTYCTLPWLAFNIVAKVGNTDIGDPLLIKASQQTVGQDSDVITQDCMLSATALRKHVQVTSVCHNMLHKLTHAHTHTSAWHIKTLYFDTSTVSWHPTHLVPVLWVHVYFINEVTCHLTVTLLGCRMQHGIGVVCLLMDPFSKQRQQELDDLNLPTFCSAVHGIAAILHQETTQVQDTVLALNPFAVETYGVYDKWVRNMQDTRASKQYLSRVARINKKNTVQNRDQ